MKKERLLFYLSVLCFFLSSAVVLLVPYSGTGARGRSGLPVYLPGVMFWLFLIAGILLQAVIHHRRKKSGAAVKGKPAVLRFCSNAPAIVFDLFGLLSLLGNILLLVAKIDLRWAAEGLIFGLLFCFEMHFVFNGETFKYVR